MTSRKHFALLLTAILAVSLIACHKDPKNILPPEPEPTPPTGCDTCPKGIDTFSLTYDGVGWGRLEGIPLLGYGVPVDRRAEARECVENARAKMRELGLTDYVGLALNNRTEIEMCYIDFARLFVSAGGLYNPRWQGDTRNFYGDEEVQANRYNYLSDTVILFVTGGPDYRNGLDYNSPLYKEVKGREGKLHCGTEADLSYNIVPCSSHLFPHQFNKEYTSIISVTHSSAGLMCKAHPGYNFNTGLEGNVQFFDQYKACGSGKAPFPYYCLSYEDAGLVNDIGVEILRWNVENLKRMGKTIVYFGTSWGAQVMTRYLLYYPIEDFAHITLYGFNPNKAKEIMISDRLIVNDPRRTDDWGGGVTGVRTGQESYEMGRWRMLPWLTRQNLSRLRIMVGSEDERFGFPTQAEIKQLTDAGATLVELVGVGHNLGSYDPYPKITDSVYHLDWERNMRIYTKDGIQVIRKAPSKTRMLSPPIPIDSKRGTISDQRLMIKNKN